MTWEQKLEALKALTPTHLEMRSPGDWYVSAYARFVTDGAFQRSAYGNGASPEEAVESDWSQLVDVIPSNALIVVGDKRVRWNGFMWKGAQ